MFTFGRTRSSLPNRLWITSHWRKILAFHMQHAIAHQLVQSSKYPSLFKCQNQFIHVLEWPAEWNFSTPELNDLNIFQDHGNSFTYTGSGGRDLSGNKRTAEQSCDQKLTKMNRWGETPKEFCKRRGANEAKHVWYLRAVFRIAFIIQWMLSGLSASGRVYKIFIPCFVDGIFAGSVLMQLFSRVNIPDTVLLHTSFVLLWNHVWASSTSEST